MKQFCTCSTLGHCDLCDAVRVAQAEDQERSEENHNRLAMSAEAIAFEMGSDVEEIERMAQDMGFVF